MRVGRIGSERLDFRDYITVFRARRQGGELLLLRSRQTLLKLGDFRVEARRLADRSAHADRWRGRLGQCHSRDELASLGELLLRRCPSGGCGRCRARRALRTAATRRTADHVHVRADDLGELTTEHALAVVLRRRSWQLQPRGVEWRPSLQEELSPMPLPRQRATIWEERLPEIREAMRRVPTLVPPERWAGEPLPPWVARHLPSA
jgi:hypothetical protein